jgi:hypothetical protein
MFTKTVHLSEHRTIRKEQKMSYRGNMQLLGTVLLLRVRRSSKGCGVAQKGAAQLTNVAALLRKGAA